MRGEAVESEHVAVGVFEHRIGGVERRAPPRDHPRDHDRRAEAGPMTADLLLAETADQVHHPAGVGVRHAAAGGGDRHFGLAVEVVHVNRDQPVHQGVLALVDAGVFLGVRGEDRPEAGIDLQIALAGVTQLGQVEDFLAQHAQQHVVGLGPAAGELVVDQRVAVTAGGRQAIIDPQRAHRLLFLQHRVDVLVDQSIAAVADVVAHQIRTAELVVAVDQHHRLAELGGQVQRQSGLAGASRPREIDWVAGVEISECPLDQFVDLRSSDEPVAGLGPD